MASSTAQEEQQPAAELPRVPSEAPSEPPEAPAYSFGPDTRSENNKKPVPNVRLPVWDGKRRTEPGAYKEWKREIKAIQLAYDIQDHR